MLAPPHQRSRCSPITGRTSSASSRTRAAASSPRSVVLSQSPCTFTKRAWKSSFRSASPMGRPFQLPLTEVARWSYAGLVQPWPKS